MFDAELKYLNVCKGRKVYVWAEERTSSNGHHLLLSSVLILSPPPPLLSPLSGYRWHRCC